MDLKSLLDSEEFKSDYYKAVRSHAFCDGGKLPCDKPPVKRFLALGRGNWFVCEDHIKEVQTYLDTNGFKHMYLLGLDEKDPPDPKPGFALAGSWSAYFRERIRGKTGAYDEVITSYNVILEKVANRVETIKVVRQFTKATIQDSAKLVDTLPSIIMKGVSRWDAVELRNALEKTGASVSLR